MKIPADIIAKIAAKSLTNRAASKLLGISESWLSQLLTKQGFERPQSQHQINQEKKLLNKTRKQFHRRLAEDVKRRAKGIAQAAEEGRCSERTIYRILETL